MRIKNFKTGILSCGLVFILVFGLSVQSLAAQKVEKEKKLVFEWLSQPQIVEKFGRISDSIWSYAELGLQEYKSAKLLADTLEEAEACDWNPG